MKKRDFTACFEESPLILTEGGVGQRLVHTFGLEPDPDIVYAAMLYSQEGRQALAAIYRSYLQVAQDFGLPILLMTNTRRANRERVLRSAYSGQRVSRDFAWFLGQLAADFACEAYVGGMLGCKGNAYAGGEGLSAAEAEAFHSWQAAQFDPDAIDFLFAGIMPTLSEAIGMSHVMADSGKPYIISLMINRDGTLLDGHSIDDAIAAIDGTAVKHPPLCYVTNCVHPDILLEALSAPANRTELVSRRFCGIQANAACMDAAALDACDVLQTSTPEGLGDAFSRLHAAFPMKIYGGCCGTDERHIAELARRFGTNYSS